VQRLRQRYFYREKFEASRTLGQLAMSSLNFTFYLLVLFEIKHFLADFPLQREYMLRKQLPGWEFMVPLSVHCSIHAIMTLAIVLSVGAQFWWLAALDFVVHFVMDRIKSGPRYLGRFHDLNRPAFWNCLGFDQMVHHLTSFFIVYQIVSSLA
jgi:hypothetical protein